MDAKLKKLIERAKKEDWIKVDEEIPKIASAQPSIDWAKEKGIKDPDFRIRDLALSILEKSLLTPEEFEKIEDTLYRLIEEEESPNARYRAAFVLASHGSLKDKERLVEILREALRDPNVKNLAENYLEKIK